MSKKIARLKENINLSECVFLNRENQKETRNSTVSMEKGSILPIEEIREEWVLCAIHQCKVWLPQSKVEIIGSDDPDLYQSKKFH